ncbi:hypothetical protein K431DRAFT_291007 [Polychaeton citri CBS 116435]|uniref:Uncharacterized protein n=1 Tax=Polychaeton citri CBS 116435 TaxID=1314669 RepID=A0A9P4USS7_9PEZI|nr:hypothetical protein K431DRAFT_291007 [Polychaeton citri CBS 116435]
MGLLSDRLLQYGVVLLCILIFCSRAATRPISIMEFAVSFRKGRGVVDLPNKDEYFIIFTGEVAPEPLKEEGRQKHEQGGLGRAIRIDGSAGRRMIDSMHRLLRVKLYSIDSQVSGLNIGSVHVDWRAKFLDEFHNSNSQGLTDWPLEKQAPLKITTQQAFKLEGAPRGLEAY